jgi:GAF domain-containing protein
MSHSIRSDIEQLSAESTNLETDWNESEHRLLNFYVKVVPKLLNAERCSLFIADREKDKIWLSAGTGVTEREIEVDVTDDSIVSEVVRTRKMVYKDELQEADGIHRQVDEKTGFVTHNILCMPFFSLDGERVTGAVQLLNHKVEGPYSTEDIDLLKELMHFLEFSIETIYLNQQSTDLIDRLYKLIHVTAVSAIGVVGAAFVLFLLYWTGVLLLG